MITRDDLNWWLELAPTLDWTFAKTYAKTAPHDYVVKVAPTRWSTTIMYVPLLQAAEHLENGKASSQYDLILVDEFQDSSQARTRMVKALVSEPGRFLLTVGDDWQAINRFAGADISSMTEFESHFGRHQAVQLETTFRCTQEICDVSSTFISKNSRQLQKTVKSSQGEHGVRVKVLKVKDQAAIKDAVGQALTALQDSVDSGSIELNKDGRVSLQILGRYGFDRDHVPDLRDAPLPDIDAQFRTIHSAKGLKPTTSSFRT